MPSQKEIDKPMTDTVKKTKIQAAEYAFPYHYIPSAGTRLWLSKHWSFSASYIAALRIVGLQITEMYELVGNGYRHIDVGCGDGALLHHLGQICGLGDDCLYGIDRDGSAISWAKMFNPTVQFDVKALSDETERFNSLSLIEVIEHIAPLDLDNFLSDAAKLLKPNGKLVLTVPSTNKRLYDKHYQHFTVESLKEVLAPHFRDVRVKGFEKHNKLSKWIERLRTNSKVRLDSPTLNEYTVTQLSRLYDCGTGCGRLFVSARVS